jgi:hypothetical protein
MAGRALDDRPRWTEHHPDQALPLDRVLQVGADSAVVAAHRQAIGGESVTCDLVRGAQRIFELRIRPLRMLGADAADGTVTVALDVTDARAAGETAAPAEAGEPRRRHPRQREPRADGPRGRLGGA